MPVEVVEGGSGESVTYEGGRVVDQQTSGEVPEGEHGDELAAAKAAVKKALNEDAKEEGKKAAAESKAARAKDPLVPRERGPDGKFLSDDDAPAAKSKAAVEEPDADASALRKALAERKATAQYKAQANAELEQMRQETRQFYAQLQREKAEIEREREKFAAFRKDPIRAIRENGWTNPEEFIMDIAQDGTPEGQARRAQRELMDRLEKAESWQKQQVEAAQRQRQEQEQNQRRGFRESVEREMIRTTFAKDETGKEHHPHLASFYKGHEVGLLAEADVVAEQYRNVTGKEASFAELAEYLEERAAKWYKSMSGAQVAPPVTQGRPAQGSVGKKSLSPAGSSERRSLGTSLADLDGDDRLEAAKTAVRAAIHASGER